MAIDKAQGAGYKPPRQESMPQEMNRLKAQKLRKKVFEDPAALKDLLKTEALTTYNANGQIVKETRGDLGES